MMDIFAISIISDKPTMQEQQNPSNLTQPQLAHLLQNIEYSPHLLYPNPGNLKQLYQSLQPQECHSQSQTSSHIQEYQQLLVERVGDFTAMCSELFYFMFYCMGYRYEIEFQASDLLVFAKKEGKFMVNIKYIRSTRHGNHPNFNPEPQPLYFPLYLKILHSLSSTLHNLRTKINYLLERINMIQQNKTTGMEKRLNYLAIKQPNILSMLRPINSLIGDAEEIAAMLGGKATATDKEMFLMLEKCWFMHEFSMLYGIRNRSITVCLYRTGKPDNRQKLMNAVRAEKKLCAIYNTLLKTKRGNIKQELEQIQNKISANFQKYVQEGWSGNPVYVKIVQPTQQQQQMLMGEEQNGDKNSNKFVFKTRLKSMAQKLELKKQNTQQDLKNMSKINQQTLQFTTEYHPNKPTMTVRLHTPIILDPSNIDQALHNWNSLGYQSLYTTLQLGQKITQKSVKYIIIKSINCFNFGQSLLCQFLRLIDLTMVTYRIIQNKIKQSNGSGIRDKDKQNSNNIVDANFSINADVMKEIDHYSLLMGGLPYKMFSAIQ